MLEPSSWQMKLQSLYVFRANPGAANATQEPRQDSDMSFPAAALAEHKDLRQVCRQLWAGPGKRHSAHRSEGKADVSAELCQRAP